ncbi:MAG: hypothetical protein ACFHX7_01115 [Pseudomonadota bacterium]
MTSWARGWVALRDHPLLPLWTGLIPIVAIHATYLVAASEGYVPWCFPYTDSCTSISATGRQGTGFILFKATMLPYALVLGLYWHRSAAVLAALGDQPGWISTIRRTGTLAAVFLVVYVVALGLAGDYLQLQRRIGIIFYFTLTAFAQLLFTARLQQCHVRDRTRLIHTGICFAFLAIGLVSLLLDSLLDNYDDMEDAFEWTLALLMQCYFITMYWTLRQPGLGIHPRREAQ